MRRRGGGAGLGCWFYELDSIQSDLGQIENATVAHSLR